LSKEKKALKEPDQMELTEQESPHAGRRGRRSIVFLTVFAAVLFLCILAVTLPQMYITKIEIEGCSEISEDSLLASTGLVTGEHLLRNVGGGFIQLFTLRYGNMESELRDEYPYISDIKIQVSFPSTVRITVSERREIGYIEIPDGYAVIDTDGYVVALADEAVPEGVALMQGIPVRTAVLGKKIDMTEEKGLNSCITVLGAILAADDNSSDTSTFSLMPCVKSIRSVQSGTTFLTILLPSTQKDFLVRLGSLKGIADDMVWLRYAAEQNKFDGVGDGVLDMTGDNYNFRNVS